MNLYFSAYLKKSPNNGSVHIEITRQFSMQHLIKVIFDWTEKKYSSNSLNGTDNKKQEDVVKFSYSKWTIDKRSWFCG